MAELEPSDLAPLDGRERFSFGASVLDFWRWSLGDLRMNTARGFLVEFFVAHAVEATTPLRVEWADYDVEGRDGTRIEVKASGYLQSWGQPKVSTPAYTFKSVASDQAWDQIAGRYVAVDPDDRVHVWVFGLQTCVQPETYDPLDLDQWRFRVVPHRQLLRTGQKSGRLSFFERLGSRPVKYENLREAIKAARAEHERLATEP